MGRTSSPRSSPPLSFSRGNPPARPSVRPALTSLCRNSGLYPGFGCRSAGCRSLMLFDVSTTKIRGRSRQSVAAAQVMIADEIVRDGGQRPLQGNCRQAAALELTHPALLFQNAEYRLDQRLAFFVP